MDWTKLPMGAGLVVAAYAGLMCTSPREKPTPLNPGQEEHVTDFSSINLEPRQDPSLKDGDVAYLRLSDGKILRMPKNTPAELHVPGHIHDGVFVMDGNVQGQGEIVASSKNRGWMELDSGDFVPMQTARPPRKPYVEGSMSEHGFLPSSRSVVR